MLRSHLYTVSGICDKRTTLVATKKQSRQPESVGPAQNAGNSFISNSSAIKPCGALEASTTKQTHMTATGHSKVFRKRLRFIEMAC
jgi:hypothetical protein